MDTKAFIQKSFQLARKDLLEKMHDLTPEELDWHPTANANSIGFLFWHMARVEDGWIQRLILRKPHLYVADGWAKKLGLPEDMRDGGYNYTPEQVGAFKTPYYPYLAEYAEAVRKGTNAYIESWNPVIAAPTVKTGWGAMITPTEVFIQLLWELNQHCGQIAYIRGLKRGNEMPAYQGPMSTTPA